MTVLDHQRVQHVVVEVEGRLLAAADVECDAEHGVVRAWMHVESGQLPPGTRTKLVDAVLDLPQLLAGARLQAALPNGDGEIVRRVQQRCSQVAIRSAGSTCLLDGRLP